MKISAERKGFTLLEVLIVLVILGVVAGLAIPIYTRSVELSRSQEALGVLAATRDAALRYYSTTGDYSAMTMAKLDYNPTAANNSGQTVHFTYALSNLAASTFTITATRNAADGGDGSSTVAMTQAGVVTKTGVYA